ncbi:serine hydrolase [Nonomuraea roseola]|uniref:serine hydrolase n=1 Tax=Nonomuraea roseola TaxID=46179 RepID=UPI003D15A715
MHLGWIGQRLRPRQGGHLQIWHNGMTGGFSSFVGFAPEKGVGVAVLSNTRRSVDRPAYGALLSRHPDPSEGAQRGRPASVTSAAWG